MNDFISKFRWVLVGGGLFILVGIIVLVAVLASGSGDSTDVAGDAPVDASGSPVAPIERVDRQEFSGEGDTKENFKAGGGLTLLRFTHSGGSATNFIVTLSQDGQMIDQVVNAIGDYEGTRAVPLPVGDYVMEVRPGAGEWTAQIDQSVPEDAPAPPAEFSGSGQSATEFFKLEAGSADFRLRHEGQGVFIPGLVRSDGTRAGSIVNESGDFSSRVTVNIKAAGIYLVDVLANGDWEIEVTQ
ncbi:MAG: hypothetical protein WD602_04755 [Actinomycetota bacterium]